MSEIKIGIYKVQFFEKAILFATTEIISKILNPSNLLANDKTAINRAYKNAGLKNDEKKKYVLSFIFIREIKAL